MDPYVINFQTYLGSGEVDPVVSIFGVCDAESDDKLSMNEIKGNADCWNMLENAGMQNTSITDEFSMIDKDQDGYVSMAEAYIAANNLDRGFSKKKKKFPAASRPLSSNTSKQKKCHHNFGEITYTDGNSPIECEKCMRWESCREAKRKGLIVKCRCTTGKCEVHRCGLLGCKVSGTRLSYVCQTNPLYG